MGTKKIKITAKVEPAKKAPIKPSLGKGSGGSIRARILAQVEKDKKK